MERFNGKKIAARAIHFECKAIEMIYIVFSTVTWAFNLTYIASGTGYRNESPSFLNGIPGITPYRVRENYSIDPEEHIFVQNAEVASHGFNAADLSLGPLSK